MYCIHLEATFCAFLIIVITIPLFRYCEDSILFLELVETVITKYQSC